MNGFAEFLKNAWFEKIVKVMIIIIIIIITITFILYKEIGFFEAIFTMLNCK